MAKARSGGRGTIASVVWFFVIGSIIFAFYQIPTNRETAGIGDIMVAKSEVMKSWVSDKAGSLDLSGIDFDLFK